MKTHLKITILCGFAFLSFAAAAHAQYSITWWTVAGGGGASTGGAYSVTGTVGQSDAGAMTGSNYGLVGGFWSYVATVPTAGAPTLTVFHTATNTVVVSWPSPSTGYVLQQTPTLSPPNWVNVAQTPADNGVTKSITIAPPTGSLFFRLSN